MMGNEVRTTNDHLRTVWTPEMDRYFIDLMLDQVSRGNRIDHNLFSKRAWKHMVTLFNAKFKSNYEKEILKNRHKSLRNVYRGVSSLLNQSSFYWDDARHMVTAENDVWDEYVKAHPGARSYRIRSIPYYRDLCLIYGNSSCKHDANVESELPSHLLDAEMVLQVDPNGIADGSLDALNGITIDEDFTISITDRIPREMAKARANAGIRTRTYWEPPMDRYFIGLMLNQMRRGNQVDGNFMKQAWTEMIDSFNAKFGFGHEVDVLKNRYKTLRRQYNVIKSLLEVDRFSWDDSRQMVVANGCVWQDYIEAHTDARQFMTRPVPHYKDICMIFHDLGTDDRELLSANNVDELQHENQQATVGHPHLEENGSRISLEMTSRKRALDQYDHQETNGKRFEGAGPTHTSLLDSSNEDDRQGSIPIEAVVEAIQALPDMDEELILDACDFLEDERRAKVFMALEPKLRRKWLIRRLRPDTDS